MTGRHRRSPRGPVAAWSAIGLVAVVSAAALTVSFASSPGSGPSAGPGSSAGQPAGSESAGAGPGAGAGPPGSASPGGSPSAVARVFPTVLRIPRIGVTTELVRLGLDPAGALAAPEAFDRAGWFEAGPVPGDRGPAVLAGHVDSRAGPAVFFRLKELRSGDEVLVDRSDGTTAVFVVASVRTFPKDGFPTDEVYGPTPAPELRLVTCGGPFDRAGGRYLDNVIVQAVPAGL